MDLESNFFGKVQDSLTRKGEPLEWIPDSKAPSCTKCYRDFKLFLRRHHCRVCGQVFCKFCSLEMDMQVDENQMRSVRVCGKCAEMNKAFAATVERS